MIQRVQTLFLIIAIGMTVAFFFVPFGYAPAMDEVTGQGVLKPLTGAEFTGLWLPSAVAIALMTVAIFTFKRYPLQKLLTVLAAIVIVATLCVVIYAVVSPYIDTNPEVTVATVWSGGGLFLIGALISDLAAYHYISKDQRLIRSLDRIR